MKDPTPHSGLTASTTPPHQPMNVNKYKLVAAAPNQIEDQVNQLIEAGWQPFGAPFLLAAKADDLTLQEKVIYQAMVLQGSAGSPQWLPTI